MADSKITALTSISTSTDPANDPLVIVDVSDTSMAATGTTKKVTLNNLLACSPTATLASATITGDLTVDTNSLYVNSGTNNVGLGTLTPSGASGRALEIYGGAGQSRIALKNDTTGSASTDGSQIALVGSQLVIQNREASEITFETNNSERYRLASDGVATWSNVGGVAGTAMTLNSTGLGVGRSPISKLTVDKASQTPGGTTPNGALVITDTVGSNLALEFGVNSAALPWIQSRNSTTNTYYDLLLNPNGGNVGIGVTPSATMKLDVQGQSIRLNSGSATGFSLLRLGGTASDSFFGFAGLANDIVTGTSAGDTVIGSNKAGANLRFISGNGALNATLDASGRLLVGKTSGVNSIETVGAGVDGRATVAGVSTVATTIYTIKQSATAAMCVVFGDDGLNGFCDIVLFLATVAPKVVSSQTLYGSPAARTYSTSTTNLQLALASGTLSIRTAALSTLNT